MHPTSYLLLASIAVLAIGLLIYALPDRWSLDTETLGAGMAAVGAFALLLSTIFAGIAATGSMSCKTQGHELEVDWRYGFNAGCRLELDDGRFVNEENWRVTEEAP